MGKLNIFVHLNAYRDSVSSNSPSLNNFKWGRDIAGIDAEKAQSLEFSLAPGETRILHDGERPLASDNTTEYDVTQKSSGVYVLKHSSGTAPVFRTKRSISSDATTVVDISVSGSFTTLQSVSGTPFNFASVVIGDEVLVGDEFEAANQGRFKVLSKTATSIMFENPSAIAESGVTLGADFDNQVRVYSASGVRAGDKIRLGTGFNTILQNTYEVIAAQDNLIEFYYTNANLPEDLSVLAPELNIYSSAKKLIYMESDQKVELEINGIQESSLEPFVQGTNSQPGILLKRSVVWSLVVTNNGSDTSNLYLASIE